MNKQATTNNNHGNEATVGRDQAIVIGNNIAGLTAARVLSAHFAQVTVIERDQAPESIDFHRNVPQSNHYYLLRSQEQSILERQFPGLIAELSSQGAVSINRQQERVESGNGARFNDNQVLSCSRSLLEKSMYRRLSEMPNVHIVQGHEVAGLAVDPRSRRVTGVWLRHRRGSTKLSADVVVDAAGSGSRAPQWLASLGYAPPLETTVEPVGGTQNRLRHYEKLPRYLEGFLVCGDAVCTLNPAYAAGVTAAVLGAQTLARCLTGLYRQNDLTGLARIFQQQLRRDIDAVWQQVTNSDRRWSATKVVEEKLPVKPNGARFNGYPVTLPARYGLAYQ